MRRRVLQITFPMTLLVASETRKSGPCLKKKTYQTLKKKEERK